MMIRMFFVDRETELSFLKRRWQSGKAELIIIYGRRGIGKTEIIKKFLEDKEGYYFYVTAEDINTLLEGFLWVLGKPYSLMKIDRLEDFYLLLSEIAKDKRIVIVFDEFQRLIDAYKGALSVLQKIWDEKLKHTNIFLILVGSAVSVFERIGKSYESPIYGRRTGMMEIKELDYWASRLFFKNYSEYDRIFAYAILGGTPLYLSKFDADKPIEENIEEKILMKGSDLYEEPEILLLQETRDPSTYMSILKTIAMGKTRFSEIADASGLEREKLPKYLNVLMNRLKLVERIQPIEEKGRSIYRITSNFIYFWFKYVLPNKSLLELGKTQIVLEQILAERDLYISHIFEDIVKQFLMRLNGSVLDGIPIEFHRIGKWWKGEKEIDLVAINEKQKIVYFVECKWSKNPLKKREFYDLITKAEEFRWKKRERQEVYIFFSRSGFEFEPEENTILIDLNKMAIIAKSQFKIRILE
ncbi:ATP-binding protein [Candidatus Bathyarchaeota archaeon]|nr:MAG: ATP-binding protein [Candidatus Bathyarchaeota archaeon]